MQHLPQRDSHPTREPLPETASLPSVPAFAKCFLSSARQRGYLPSAIEKALGKQMALGKEVVCRVLSTRQRPGLPSVGYSANQNTRQRAAAANGWQPPLTLTLGKAVICRVSFFDTRQTIFFSLLTSKLFLRSSYNTWYSMFQCGTFLGLFLYLFNLFHLIEFSWIIQIIIASHSNNEKK